ncbi:winged helix-turn-helix transcriptional regulator [Corallococcus exiguus]|uniref:ArsR/SmtB family transcription factor n=1 Tax=Corallococcus exiguus TaxID=83462 RepID=UPI0014714D22|nr:metalloregulator ArsR/SmtB family transcription factor [Corallococcus exiguus]NNB95245.1 winged helix-turn-helix transcriptional regulator [Corallococcus exiguus]NNC03587.1 winged helix-turn-helix transcriptional regulator [Corallococcus exiguus]
MKVIPSTLADVFKALSDEHRLKMLDFIATKDPDACRTGEGICACDVQDFIGLAQPTVSQHLRILVDAGLLDVERRGKWNYYTLNAKGFTSAQKALEHFQTLAPSTRKLRPAS